MQSEPTQTDERKKPGKCNQSLHTMHILDNKIVFSSVYLYVSTPIIADVILLE